MKVWITKYALSIGMSEVDAEICSTISENMISVKEGNFHSLYHKGEWFKEKDLAIADADKRRKRKIASLEKQIDKLSKLSFK